MGQPLQVRSEVTTKIQPGANTDARNQTCSHVNHTLTSGTRHYMNYGEQQHFHSQKYKALEKHANHPIQSLNYYIDRKQTKEA